MRYFFVVLSLFVIPISLSATNLDIQLKGIRNGTTSILVESYDNPTSFKARKGRTIRFDNVVVKNETAQINVPFEQGKHAFIVYHDENQNGRVDLGSFEQSIEGWGTPKFHEGIMGFEDMVVVIDEENHTETISILYPRKVALTCDGLDDRSGFLMFRIYTSEETFLKPESAFLKDEQIKITGEAMRFELALLPGNYVFNCIHDENGNGELDKMFIGLPTEDYGFSRGERAVLGPPKFSGAVVTIGAGTEEISHTITVK